MLEFFIEILLIAITGYVFCNILTDAGMIFDFYYKQIERYEVSKPKLYKVLGGCNLCFTGQLALWYFILVHALELEFIGYLFKAIFFVSATIFTVNLINIIDDRLQRD